MRMIQRDLHKQLRTAAVAARQRLADLIRPLDPAQLQEHPEAKGWSVAEVLEHLCVTHEASSAPAVVAARAARPDAGAAAREWRPVGLLEITYFDREVRHARRITPPT